MLLQRYKRSDPVSAVSLMKSSPPVLLQFTPARAPNSSEIVKFIRADVSSEKTMSSLRECVVRSRIKLRDAPPLHLHDDTSTLVIPSTWGAPDEEVGWRVIELSDEKRFHFGVHRHAHINEQHNQPAFLFPSATGR